jgi:hypothetical protein
VGLLVCALALDPKAENALHAAGQLITLTKDLGATGTRAAGSKPAFRAAPRRTCAIDVIRAGLAK